MKTEKGFDSVKMMREIRDRLSKQFVNISYEEQKDYITKRIKDKAKITQGIKNNNHVAG